MINLLPDSDQQQIIDSIAGFLSSELPVERLRHGSKRTREGDCWQAIAELGLFGLGLPEDIGGADFSIVEEVLAFREMGRNLMSPAVFATTMAAHAAATAGRFDLVEGLIAGTQRAAPAIKADISGKLMMVDASDADFIFVQSAGVTSLYARDALGNTAPARALDDATSLELADIAGAAIVELTDPVLIRRGRLLITAMLVSIGEQARDMAVDYAKERRQFNRPIGAFQAIKHRCADMAVRSEMSCSQLFFAAVHERDEADDAAFQGTAATLLALEAALQNTAASIQIHGGIGFTAEFDAHRFLKRAHLLEQMAGSARVQQARILDESLP